MSREAKITESTTFSWGVVVALICAMAILSRTYWLTDTNAADIKTIQATQEDQNAKILHAVGEIKEQVSYIRGMIDKKDE